jgi:hypothetical protein
MPDFENSQAK